MDMTFDEAARFARVQANIARAMITMNAMIAENMRRQALGYSMAYGEAEFIALIDEQCIGYNAIECELYPANR